MNSWAAVTTATHWTPLPAPPTADATQATSRLGAKAVPRYAMPIAAVPPIRSAASDVPRSVEKSTLPTTIPTAPGCEHEAVAEVAGVQRFLRERDLDRKHQSKEDERDRLGGEEPPEHGALAYVGEAEPQAGGPGNALVLLVAGGARKGPGGGEENGDRNEGGGVGEERNLGASGGDEEAGQGGPSGSSRREAEVENPVALTQ